ncbi:hypothetical protein J7L33_04880 [Candidatus Bathyarchaeota archaeon]|nr:hypothetical protein [Candidatus Bathyarchaeota archaeon]
MYLSFFLSILNFLVIQYHFIVKKLPYVPSFVTFILVFAPLYFAVATLIGFYERKKKVLETEVEIFASENPLLKEINERLKRIEREVERWKEKG